MTPAAVQKDEDSIEPTEQQKAAILNRFARAFGAMITPTNNDPRKGFYAKVALARQAAQRPSLSPVVALQTYDYNG